MSSSSSISVDDLLFRAKLAEQSERYDEMADLMRRLALSRTEPLSDEERAVFAVAFKNASGERRAAWRKICAIERGEADHQQQQQQPAAATAAEGGAAGASTPNVKTAFGSGRHRHRLALIRHYKSHIEAELNLICNQVLTLLSEHLIPVEDAALHVGLRAAMSAEVRDAIRVGSPAAIDDAERTIQEAVAQALVSAGDRRRRPSLVFWYKMAGDYRRFLSELLADGCEARDRQMCLALEAYAVATCLARDGLAPCHPIRLGLALNFAVFFYEILQMRTPACRRAENSFNEAVADLDQLNDDALYSDALLVMQLLKDNLKNWTAADQDDDPTEDAAVVLRQ